MEKRALSILLFKRKMYHRPPFCTLLSFGVLLAGVLFQQLNAQWERVPLYGGHVDKFSRSAFDSNMVFAVTRWGNIYYTRDQNDWKPLFNTGILKPFGNNMVGIPDVAHTRRNSLIVLADPNGYRSTDWGNSWSRLQLPENRDPLGSIHACKSGSIIIYRVQNSYISEDDGVTWAGLNIPNELQSQSNGLYVDTDSVRIMIIYGFSGTLGYSTDKGGTWHIISQFDKNSMIYNVSKYSVNDSDIYGLIVKYDGNYHYYESTDTCKTWKRIDISLPMVEGNMYHLRSPALLNSSGNFMFSVGQKYFISTDYGISWQHDDKLHSWDFIKIGNRILGSFTLEGALSTTDEGRTWDRPQPEPQISAFYTTEYKAATREIGFCIVGDTDEDQSGLYELRKTTHRGYSWETLFRSPLLEKLIVRSRPEERYYAMSRNHEIISGIVGQSVPDTIVSWEENTWPSYFVSTDAFPDYMFVSAIIQPMYGTFLTTTNGGSNWQNSGIPANRFSVFSITPSIAQPDLVVGTGFAGVGSQDLLLGLYLNRHLGGWIHQTYMVVEKCSLVEYDQLFSPSDISFSGDYGKNWSRNIRGLDTTFNQISPPFFMSRDRLFICTDWNGQKLWYYFRDGSWHPVRDGTGNPVQSPAPGMLEMIEDDLYAAYPYQGLFRLSNGLTTGTDRPANSPPRPSLLSCYPNPFHNSTEISFTLSERTKVALFVVDIFGRTVARLVDEEKEAGNHRIRFDGGGLANGMYFYRLTAKNISLTGKMCLVR